jgi:Fe2+ or Zn2+ uptake regulation protein
MTDEELIDTLNVPYRFWTCDRCHSSYVSWSGEVATCESCGNSSDSKDKAIEYRQ